MKRRTRRLMSLLMAIAIACSMVPAAMAYSGSSNSDLYEWLQQYYAYYCPNDKITGSHDLAYSYVSSTTHQVYCANGCGYVSRTEAHTSTCGCIYNGSYNPNYGDYYGHNHEYEYYNSAYHYVECMNVPSCDYFVKGLEEHSHTYYCTYCGYNNSGIGSYGNVIWSSNMCGMYYNNHTPVYQYSDSNYDHYTCSNCTAWGYAIKGSTGIGAGSFYITGSTNQIEANGGYILLSAVPTYTGSLLDLTQLQWFSSNNNVAQIYNYGQNSATGSSVYVYGVSAGTATIYAQLPNTDYYAAYEVTVGSTTDASVMYSLTTGESLVLDSESFEDFWSEVTSGYGALDYVVFGSASGSVGQLTYRRTGASAASSAIGNAFYADPNYSQYGIDDVTFTPSAATTSGYRTGTLTVPFTAYGTDSYYGATNVSYRGTLYIMVTNGEVADITYKHIGSTQTLVPTDFTGVYKAALNITAANPTIYIQFVDVPVSGDLYYNYGAGYGYNSGTKLLKSNIDSLRFSTGSVASYGVDDVTYVPGSGNMGDTVTYVAYSSATGGTPLYVGKILFGAGTLPEIRYYAAINKTVALDAEDFYSSADLRNVEYITFGTPSSGTLYKNYANGTGTRVTSSNAFTVTGTGSNLVPNISTLTYVPAANFTGVVEIPFTGSNVLGSEVSGTVKIYVAKAFSDLTGYTWASDYIIRLTAEGVVNGVTATTYAPGAKLKYGEALKLIMEATDTSASLSTSGHWAKNYLTKAYTMGLVSSTNIDLNSEISRDQVAELAAKALGLSKASSVTGTVKPTDSTNGYVYALYNAGILNGTTEPNGKNYYYGSNTINRAEISKIICLVSDYYAANK